MNENVLPTSPQQLLDRLTSLRIAHHVVHHPPLFTVEESKALRGELPGHHIKNLFLRDRRERMFLVVAQEDRRIDLKALAPVIGAEKLSFGSAERLMKYLGVLPGAVTPFALINDRDADVSILLDRSVMSGGAIHCHPLVNDMTVALQPEDLLRFLRETGHEPRLIDIPERAAG
jgi:Ala-tRNA(Pro) deacylase